LSRRRFFINSKEINADRAFLKDSEHHHLAHVLRLKAGDDIYIFTENREEYLAEVIKIERERSTILIKKKIKDKGVESSLKITLFQAIARGSRMKMIVQKATELGVEALVPLITERSVHPKNVDDKLKRWQRIALEAAKQCGRTRGINIGPIIKIEEIDFDKLTGLKLILWEKKGRGIKEITNESSISDIALMVGPEGGWTDREIDWVISNGFMPINLGPRVLRTETASLAALSILQYQFGDIG
jgi:16S rRNA (uracil1498-N3)-methyltransferase